MATHRAICVQCRTVGLIHLCDHDLVLVSSKWRAPTRGNHRAWKRIANGQLLWDNKSIERSLRKERERVDRVRERLRQRKKKTRV